MSPVDAPIYWNTCEPFCSRFVVAGVQCSSGITAVNVKPIKADQDIFDWLHLGDFTDVANEPRVLLPEEKGRLSNWLSNFSYQIKSSLAERRLENISDVSCTVL